MKNQLIKKIFFIAGGILLILSVLGAIGIWKQSRFWIGYKDPNYALGKNLEEIEKDIEQYDMSADRDSIFYIKIDEWQRFSEQNVNVYQYSISKKTKEKIFSTPLSSSDYIKFALTAKSDDLYLYNDDKSKGVYSGEVVHIFREEGEWKNERFEIKDDSLSGDPDDYWHVDKNAERTALQKTACEKYVQSHTDLKIVENTYFMIATSDSTAFPISHCISPDSSDSYKDFVLQYSGKYFLIKRPLVNMDTAVAFNPIEVKDEKGDFLFEHHYGPAGFEGYASHQYYLYFKSDQYFILNNETANKPWFPALEKTAETGELKLPDSLNFVAQDGTLIFSYDNNLYRFN